MNKPSILFFVPGLNVGGAERHTADLRVRLDERGFKTEMLVFGPRRSPVMLEHPGTRGAVFLDLIGMSDFAGWFRVHAAFGRQPSDVIVTVNQTPLIVAVVTRLFKGTSARIICIYHTTVLRENERRRLFLFRWALRFADALVFVSANQKKYWIEQGLRCAKMPVVLNGIDLGQFVRQDQNRAAKRAELGFRDADVVIGLVATFRPEKSHEFLVEAIKRLHDLGRPVKGLLVGNGPTREAIERMVDDYQIRDLIVFAGEQSDVRPFMVACDIGVLCSVAVETFSLSAIEFLALDVPMIMSRVGARDEIVTDGVNGYLFEAGNIQDFVDRLDLALANLARLSATARPSVERLSIESMANQYVALIGSLGAGTGD